ncbi:twin-arginine translocation signal domain-containing protein [Planotetraspora sp. A-T 1434]
MDRRGFLAAASSAAASSGVGAVPPRWAGCHQTPCEASG